MVDINESSRNNSIVSFYIIKWFWKFIWQCSELIKAYSKKNMEKIYNQHLEPVL